jgi:hypothetical protein
LNGTVVGLVMIAGIAVVALRHSQSAAIEPSDLQC